MKRTPHGGFNLIEAAIVLGIVGLVLGGIWVAASAVQQASLSNRLSEGVLFISQKANQLVPKNMLFPATSTSLPYDMGLFPKNWTISGTDYYAPNGMRVQANIEANTATLRLYMRGGEMDLAQCIKFTRAIIGVKDIAIAYAPSGNMVRHSDPSTQTLAYITSACEIDTNGYLFAVSVYVPINS